MLLRARFAQEMNMNARSHENAAEAQRVPRNPALSGHGPGEPFALHPLVVAVGTNVAFPGGQLSMGIRSHKGTRPSRSAAAGSWVALLAATTLGDVAGTVHAEVRADGLAHDRAYRLVVQSYDAGRGAVPGPESRPVGSTQRAVTADELAQGVHVDLLELREGFAEPAQGPVVVAWIEAGQPDLEFDGRTARPAPGSVYGVAKRNARRSSVSISLNRKLTV